MVKTIESSEIERFVKKLKSITITSSIITTHKNADPDAIASSYALIELLKETKAGIKTYFILPEGLSAASKRLIENLKISIEMLQPKKLDNEIIKNIDSIFIVDTCSPEQLGVLKDIIQERANKAKIFIIDHHFPHKDLVDIAYAPLVLNDARATSEIVFLLYEKLGIPLSKEAANMLLAGIVYDTRHFILARPETFNIVAGLIKSGANYPTILKALQTKMDISERMARLKAAQRMHIHKINNWIIVTTNVGAYEASAARAILDLGADVAFVASEDKGEVRVSVRAKEDFCKSTGIHFGRDVMKPLGEFLRGGGGGHETAAAASGKGSAELALIKCLELLRNLLKSKGDSHG